MKLFLKLLRLHQAYFLRISAVSINLSVVNFFLCDPFLQLPTNNSVNVVWFTSEKGESHFVEIESSKVFATSKKLDGWNDLPDGCNVYRHEAIIENISAESKFTYRVISYDNLGDPHLSEDFSLSSLPLKDKDLKILLTSDHQCRMLIPLLLKAAKLLIEDFDAIFYAGDFGNAINSYEYWFSHPAALFASLQGKAKTKINESSYNGAEMIQNIPIIPAFGNHDIPDFGRIKTNPQVPEWQFFNDIFSLPLKEASHAPYYSMIIGDIYLIVLAVARTYQSDFSYVPIEEGSEQYRWLLDKLQSKQFEEAEFRIVMMHHPIYTLNPDPFNFVCTTKERFSHERNNYSLIETLGSLFEKYKVDLVFNGHDHIWNHFLTTGGVHYLSSSLAVAKDKGLPLLNKCSNGLEPVFPNKKQFRIDGKLVPYPVGSGAVFSVLETKTKQVKSFFCSLKGEALQCTEFDTFSLSRTGKGPVLNRACF